VDKLANASLEGSTVLARIRGGKGAFGLNALTETYEDLVQAGGGPVLRPGSSGPHTGRSRLATGLFALFMQAHRFPPL